MPFAVKDSTRGIVIDTVSTHEACAAIHYMTYTTGEFNPEDFDFGSGYSWRSEFPWFEKTEGAQIVVVGILEVHNNEGFGTDQSAQKGRASAQG